MDARRASAGRARSSPEASTARAAARRRRCGSRSGEHADDLRLVEAGDARRAQRHKSEGLPHKGSRRRRGSARAARGGRISQVDRAPHRRVEEDARFPGEVTGEPRKIGDACVGDDQLRRRIASTSRARLSAIGGRPRPPWMRIGTRRSAAIANTGVRRSSSSVELLCARVELDATRAAVEAAFGPSIGSSVRSSRRTGSSVRCERAPNSSVRSFAGAEARMAVGLVEAEELQRAIRTGPWSLRARRNARPCRRCRRRGAYGRRRCPRRQAAPCGARPRRRKELLCSTRAARSPSESTREWPEERSGRYRIRAVTDVLILADSIRSPEQGARCLRSGPVPLRGAGGAAHRRSQLARGAAGARGGSRDEVIPLESLGVDQLLLDGANPADAVLGSTRAPAGGSASRGQACQSVPARAHDACARTGSCSRSTASSSTCGAAARTRRKSAGLRRAQDACEAALDVAREMLRSATVNGHWFSTARR